MLTTAGKTFPTASTAGSAAGSAWAKVELLAARTAAKVTNPIHREIADSPGSAGASPNELPITAPASTRREPDFANNPEPESATAGAPSPAGKAPALPRQVQTTA